jgi:hypothetical protein
MKNSFKKSAIAASLLFVLAAASFKSQAQEVTSFNDTYTNVSVAITVKNADGAAYVIKNEKGLVVYTGRIKNNKTFHIPGRKLGVGTFYFYVGNQVYQTFEVSDPS